MPWTRDAGMIETGLEAIYSDLQQVPAVRNAVAAFAADPKRAVTLGSIATGRMVAH
jgi:hypothetical protein